MFKIYDGRNEFYQWDVDQKLIVFNPEIKEVHFCNQTSDTALVCEVYNDGGLRVVDVPNILLQSTWPVKAYAHCDCATKNAHTFNVVARSKPADYVYTETEVMSYAQLEKRVEALEKGAGLDIDFEAFVKHEELEAKGYITEVPGEYVTETELEAKGYLTGVPGDYAKSTEVTAEKTRAEAAELILDTKISTETTRATAAENVISQNLANHTATYDAKVLSLETKDQALEDAINQHKREVDALLASDDITLDQLQEIVDYIKNNSSLIAAITTNKVSVSAIVDNLLSSATDKPLSANQGRVLNELITALTTALNAHKTAYDAKVAELANADTTNANAISAEVTRAKAAEAELSGKVSDKLNANGWTTNKGAAALISPVKDDQTVLISPQGISVTNEVTPTNGCYVTFPKGKRNTALATLDDIPTVNNGTLTIQQNGTDVATFTANQSGDTTANITIPADTNTTYDLSAPTNKENGNVSIDLTAGGSGSGTDSVTIKGAGATTVTTDENGVITISSTNTDTNTIYSGIGICNTASTVAAKIVTLPKFSLAVNSMILFRMSTSNTATSGVTLNVNSTGAKPIYIGGSAWGPKN